MKAVEFYMKPNGKVPVADWIGTLDDATAARILARFDRVALGNFGEVSAVGQGVWELKFDFGPGYRVYYTRVGFAVILLLQGGDKSTQRRDIVAAQANLEEYESRSS